MKKILLLLVALTSLTSFAGDKLKLQDSVFDNSDLPFIVHNGEGRFGSYLTMEVNFEPVADLFKQLLLQKRFQLTNRGEAHITVITPIEYFDVLKSKVTIEEINLIARDLKIQSSRFSTVCLGRGQAQVEGKKEKTFYVVVKSEDLIEIRKEVHNLFVSRGGDRSLFNPEEYYPHITLGFTKRDLHESDGVIKSEESCHKNIQIVKSVE